MNLETIIGGSIIAYNLYKLSEPDLPPRVCGYRLANLLASVSLISAGYDYYNISKYSLILAIISYKISIET